MGNQITDKRGLIVILIVGTVIVFIGLLWAIATFLPFNLPDSASPTETMDAPREKENCASPVGYWTRHPELYPGRVVIGEHVYEAAELETVFSDQSDLQALLQAQLASAYLNILLGADQSYIQSTIYEAYGWLVAHPMGSQVGVIEAEDGKRLLNLLEAYNLGMTGVPACKSALPFAATRVKEKVETDTETATITPSETTTLLPTETSTIVEYPPTVTYEYIQPTRAATRTPEPPIQYPTNTPVPPTQALPPTNTQPPPPTNPPVEPPTITPPPDIPTITPAPH